MKKQEFLNEISARLKGLPDEEIRRSIDYFSEMIDDRMEDGMSEEEAVEAAGSVDDAVNDILKDVPLTKVIKAKASTRRKLRAWEIVLLIIGSPICFPLLLCFVILIWVIYIIIWAIVVCFWAIVLAFLVGGAGAVGVGILSLLRIPTALPALAIAAGLVLMGISLLLIGPMIKLSKVTGKLAKVIVLWIKSWFIGGKKNA